MIPGENYATLNEIIQDLKNFLNGLTKPNVYRDVSKRDTSSAI